MIEGKNSFPVWCWHCISFSLLFFGFWISCFATQTLTNWQKLCLHIRATCKLAFQVQVWTYEHTKQNEVESCDFNGDLISFVLWPFAALRIHQHFCRMSCLIGLVHADTAKQAFKCECKCRVWWYMALFPTASTRELSASPDGVQILWIGPGPAASPSAVTPAAGQKEPQSSVRK